MSDDAKEKSAAAKAARAELRAAMPWCTQIIDEYRAVFGVPAGIRATENGQTVEWGTLK